MKLDPLEEHLLERLRELPAGEQRRRRGRGDLAGADRQPAVRLRRPRPEGHRPKLLHDRLGRTREQRRRRAGAATDRPGAAPLPLRRLLSRPRGAGGPGRRARHPAGSDRGGGGADRRRAAQGLRPSRAGGDPADLDDRLAPAARGRCRLRDRAREEARRRAAVADDSIVVCSFGDASVNHATAQAALNSAAHSRTRACRCPCSSSARTTGSGSACARPRAGSSRRCARVRRSATRPRPATIRSAARDRSATWSTGSARERRPAVLHLRMVRFLSHAGADVEAAYRTPAEIRADWDADPLLATGRWLVAAGVRTGEELARRTISPSASACFAIAARGGASCRSSRRRRRSCVRSRRRPPRSPRRRAGAASERAADARAGDQRGARRRARARPATVLVFGEDVAVKGGVYGVTRGLQHRFGAAASSTRCSTRRRSSASRSARRSAASLPVPEIQYLAYLHNAEDQLRGEAATLQFFSQGQYRNPMVVRVAGLRLPEGLRRALPQRQRGRRAPRHPRPRRRLAGAAGRRGGDAADLPRGGARSTAACACSSSRSRCTTRVTCTRTATSAGSRRPRRRHAPLGAARVYGDGARPDDRDVGERPADVAAGRAPAGRRGHRAPASSTCAGSRRCRWTTSCARRARPARPRRRRDAPHRRRRGGRRRRARRRGVRRPRSRAWRAGLVHPARRRGEPGARSPRRRSRRRRSALVRGGAEAARPRARRAPRRGR